ncbi:MAG: TAXI family TRAP transporter solute-binding subunit [Minwuia sp.]|nr:TAXI family TRAP transporter solute-binding subunit [Minwuia sp.]
MRERSVTTAIAAILMGFMLIAASATRAQDVRLFRIGTGSTAGTYYPIGALIASAISRPPGSAPCDEGGACGVDNLIATAVTSRGSFDNIEGLLTGRFDSALSQADIAAWAYRGDHVFTGKLAYPQLRSIANLYAEHVHLVVRRDLGILSVSDLKGKRVAIDRVGSGTRINTLLILNAFGVEASDIESVEMGPEPAISALLDGTIDAAFFVVGYPSAAVTELAETGRFTVAPIAGVAADQLMITNRFYTAGALPPGVYHGVGTTPTLQVGAQWIVNAKADAELIYQITRAFWKDSNRSLLNSGHVKGKQIRLQTALEGLTVPLHPGAQRFYEEMGLLPAEPEPEKDAGPGEVPAAGEGTGAASAAPESGSAPESGGAPEPGAAPEAGTAVSD